MDILYFSHALNSRGEKLAKHCLWYWDITIVLEGELSYKRNGTPITVREGDAIVFMPGDVRQRDRASTFVNYYSFNFTLDPSENLPEMYGLIRNCLTSEVKERLSLYEQCVSSHSKFNSKRSNYCLSSLFLSLYELTKTSKTDNHIDNIIKYIDKHLYDTIKLKDIADSVFLSPNHCSTIFKNEMGQTIIDFVLERKMKEAKRIMLETDKTLSEVATCLGYNDYSYFSRIFKKVTGISPAEFRKGFVGKEKTS